MLKVPGLYITYTPEHGRGVFTAGELKKGDLIEICPVIVIPPEHVAKIHASNLHDYYFLWPEPKDSACIALGYGSLYNHKASPNAHILLDVDMMEIVFKASKDIGSGEEIFIDYNDGLDDDSALWFTPKP